MQGANPESFYSLLTLDDLMLPVMLINLALGVVIGALGSMVSVRKYVKV
jgi:cell division protein FtsX